MSAPEIICVSGDPGSGKTTVGRGLRDKLRADYLSMGDVHRGIAQSLDISVRELNELAESDPQYDQKIDEAFEAALNSKMRPLIVDARMGWLRLPASLKIRFTCSPETAGERIFSAARSAEQFTNREDCISDVTARRESERRRYWQTYGVHVEDASHYDIVVVTDKLAVPQIVDALAGMVDNRTGTLVVANPSMLWPTRTPDNQAAAAEALQVFQEGDQFHLVAGHAALAKALAENAPFFVSSLVPSAPVSGVAPSVRNQWAETFPEAYGIKTS